ncbi:MAG: hypothetical protein QNK37_21130 [Acidobacteriota bacterium]|nr:hypothetical protein [Acidobacteriota bacterium]
MFCNRAREEINRRKSGAFEPENQPEFEAHLESCADCKGLYQASITLEEAAASWRDEAVPNWQRGAAVFPAQARPAFWLTWAPLAACLLMTLLVVFRVEVHRGPNGWRIAFDGQQTDTAEAMTAEVVQGLLEEHRRQSTLEMISALDRYTQQSEANLRTVLDAYRQSNRLSRNREFELLQTRWREQRAEDLDVLQAQMSLLLRRQNRQLDNLNTLSRRVNRTSLSRN